MRADIAKRRSKFSEFTLPVEIPLHHIIAVRIVFHESVFPRWSARLDCGKRASGECPRQLSSIGRTSELIERCPSAVQSYRRIEHRKYIKHSKTTTHRGLAISERIPGKSNSGFKVVQG